MDYGILGPLQLRSGPELVAVPGGRQRDLIALLVTRAGQVISSDRLIEDLWGGSLPAHPGNALQQRIVQVRKLLDPTGTGAVLRTESGGYRLDVAPDAIDARRFERLAASGHAALAAGDPARAAALLTDALAPWRGPALAGIDAPWAQAEARRLEELRLVAWEDRFDAQLALGESTALTAELERLVEAHPLRERLRGQLMAALARSGRQAEALAVYADIRALLAEELGIDPSPQLQRAQADVLRQHAVAGPPSPRPRRVPPAARLPVPASSFVGREQELQRLGALLVRERIVTLIGPGGAGKTRLAVEAARRVQEEDPAGAVHFVELASVVEPDAVASTMAAALGLDGHGRSASTVAEAIAASLEHRRALLVVDSCEHVLAAVCALVDGLVAASPGLRVLATSREPLGVDGEVVWPLPPLPLPPTSMRTAVAAEAHAAVRLFTDRTAAVVPGYRLTDDEVGAVVRIVRRLDGLPLAIELAAARARVLSIQEIADRLGDRFRLLAGGRRSAPTRHRALWDTLEWSWDLLDDRTRRAWMAASVPAGPFTAELFQVLLEAVGCELDALSALSALTDRSLLTVHERGRTTRYRMLGTLREFGAHLLLAQGLDDAVRAAHARAVEAAVAAADETTSHRWSVDLDAQRRWLPEARAALQWEAQRGDRRAMQRLAAGLGWLWYLTALSPEGLRWLDVALGPVGDLDPEDVEPAAVLWAAALRVNEAPQDDGLRWAQLAVDVAPGDLERVFAELFVVTHRAIADDAVAAAAAAHRTDLGDGWLAGVWQLLEAQLLAQEGDVLVAEQLLDGAERMLVEHGAWWGIWTSATLAQLSQLRGDAEAVRRTASRALPVCVRMDAPELEVELRCLLAMVAAATGQQDRADEELQQARVLVAATGVAMSRALVANAAGEAHRRRGETGAARAHLEEALRLHDRAGQPFGRPFTLWSLGHLALREGDIVQATDLLRRSFDTAQQRTDADAVARALEGLAATCAAGGASALGARLLGAAAARRAAMRAPAPIISRDDARAAERRLREAMGEQAFAAELRAGGALDEAEVGTALALVPAGG